MLNFIRKYVSCSAVYADPVHSFIRSANACWQSAVCQASREVFRDMFESLGRRDDIGFNSEISTKYPRFL